jgi:hypothetical protein
LFPEYHRANFYYPKMVIVFRDGVGDGQLETAVLTECQQGPI